MLRKFLLLAAIVVGVPQQAFALAMHEPSTTPSSLYQDFGLSFPEVGWLYAEDGGVYQTFSSSVLIDDHWVLTSAHGVLANELDHNSVYDSIRIGFGASTGVDLGENMYADEVFVNPFYGGLEDGPDLALLYFDDPFLSVDPVELYTGSLAVLVSDDAHFAGYGAPAIVGGILEPLDGIRRAGTNVVTSVTPIEGNFIRARLTQPGFSDFRSLGALGTGGDSGGGWFVESGGDLLLAGISSFATSNIHYGGSTYATPIASNLDWINDTIASKIVPEPNIFLLALLGALGLTTRRRRLC